MALLIGIGIMTVFMAYTNGANSNFKGVATLYGGAVTDYRTAVILGTTATFLGGLCSVFLATGLIKAFSGSGIVPERVVASPAFLIAVAVGASVTVLSANLLGLPVATTHGLIGGLVGAGLVAAGSQLNLRNLERSFLAPLLLSPILAAALSRPLCALNRLLADRLGGATGRSACHRPGTARTRMRTIVDVLHGTSAVAVSFARGLNDTPKMVALLLSIEAFGVRCDTVGVSIAIAVGGLFGARKVAATMSEGISRMDGIQAVSANVVTALLVVAASYFGWPVSTTHVAVGSIFGVGLANQTADSRVMATVVFSWILTLPLAAVIAGLTYVLLVFNGAPA